jgi:hypothetical protein
MALRRIGLEVLRFSTKTLRQTSPNELHSVIDFGPAEWSLSALYEATMGEKALPPAAMFKALLLTARSRSFRCAACRGARRPGEFWALCGFARDEATGDCGQGGISKLMRKDPRFLVLYHHWASHRLKRRATSMHPRKPCNITGPSLHWLKFSAEFLSSW